MATGRESDAVEHPPEDVAVQTTPPADDAPEISVCEGGPDRVVFLEDGNSDAWIASDVAVDVDE